jgi:hypothetical protein
MFGPAIQFMGACVTRWGAPGLARFVQQRALLVVGGSRTWIDSQVPPHQVNCMFRGQRTQVRVYLRCMNPQGTYKTPHFICCSLAWPCMALIWRSPLRVIWTLSFTIRYMPTFECWLLNAGQLSEQHSALNPACHAHTISIHASTFQCLSCTHTVR